MDKFNHSRVTVKRNDPKCGMNVSKWWINYQKRGEDAERSIGKSMTLEKAKEMTV